MPKLSVVGCVSLILFGLLSGCTRKNNENPSAPAPEAAKSAEGDGKEKGTEASLVDRFNDAYETQGLTPAEKRGRQIWYQATTGNATFHSYVIPQRYNVYIDWDEVLSSRGRDQRFKTWGIINDPDCVPGDESTFGFDRCPGDEKLLSFVGKEGYQDPACGLEDQIPGPLDKTYKREDACKLAFGTSAGAVGFRKFPNPKFNLALWKKLNGGSVLYKNYKKDRLTDESVQPPFLVGLACASCHVGLSPTNPPANPNHPEWHNVIGTFGSQHLRMSEILGSGMPTTNILFQALTNAQPGATDTSAFSHDEIFNPGTINAIFNTDIRVRDNLFPNKITRSRRDPVTGKFGPREEATTKVPAILKGGEDSVGVDLAVQRVYVNIGMCSRECWVNHLLNTKALTGRNSTQTPFNIEQCRKDCAEWRSLEDRVTDVIAFLKTRRPTDLKDAVDPTGKPVGKEIVAKLQADEVMHDGKKVKKLELGQRVFAENCARCHSSQKPTRPGQKPTVEFFKGIKDFLATEPMEIKDGDKVYRVDQVRKDWLGNDALSPVLGGTEAVGTNYCRSLHTNHQPGHVWEPFASNTYWEREAIKDLPDVEKENDGKVKGTGRGYYRNISLISVWSTAPFLHNNELGPKLCNHTPFMQRAMAKHGGKRPASQEGCVEPEEAFTIEKRLEMFEESMNQLLGLKPRPESMMVTYDDIEIEVGAKLLKDFNPANFLFAGILQGQSIADGIKIKIPVGFPVYLLASLDERKFIQGQLDEVAKEPNVANRYQKMVERMAGFSANPDRLKEELKKYSNCHDAIENKGHTFGDAIKTQEEKEALIAFLKLM